MGTVNICYVIYTLNRMTQGKYLFDASHLLIHALIKEITNCQRDHLNILQEMFSYFLDVISKICEHGNLEALDNYLEKAKDILCLWMNNGASSMGDPRGIKLSTEIKVFMLHCVYDIHVLFCRCGLSFFKK